VVQGSGSFGFPFSAASNGVLLYAVAGVRVHTTGRRTAAA
jgi:hypothetical protein